MVVLCCPVVYHREARDSLFRYAPDAVVIPLTTADFRGWWREIKVYYGVEDLITVEHDNILHAGVLPQFGACPELWCLFPYRHPGCGDGWMDSGVGCTRFRKEIVEFMPVSLVEAQGGSCSRCEGVDPSCWIHVDGRFNDAGRVAGLRPHVHWPSVGHRDVPGGEYQEPHHIG
jgi:hypothetical protein